MKTQHTEDSIQTPQEDFTSTNNLKKVTPLSKYLTAALFIILPFLGAYLGYNLAFDGEDVISQDDTPKEENNEENTSLLALDGYHQEGECDLGNYGYIEFVRKNGVGKMILLFNNENEIKAATVAEIRSAQDISMECSVDNSVIRIALMTGEIGIGKYEYIFFDTSSFDIVNRVSVYIDNNGPRNAGSVDLNSENSYYRFLTDVSTGSLRAVLLNVEKEGEYCNLIDECIEASSTISVIRDENISNPDDFDSSFIDVEIENVTENTADVVLHLREIVNQQFVDREVLFSQNISI